MQPHHRDLSHSKEEAKKETNTSCNPHQQAGFSNDNEATNVDEQQQVDGQQHHVCCARSTPMKSYGPTRLSHSPWLVASQ